jgi:hypothetical protein
LLVWQEEGEGEGEESPRSAHYRKREALHAKRARERGTVEMPVGPTQVPRGAQKHVGPKPGAVRAQNRKGGWKAQLRSPTFKPGYEIPLFNETGHGFDKERFEGGGVSWKDLPTAQGFMSPGRRGGRGLNPVDEVGIVFAPAGQNGTVGRDGDSARDPSRPRRSPRKQTGSPGQAADAQGAGAQATGA